MRGVSRAGLFLALVVGVQLRRVGRLAASSRALRGSYFARALARVSAGRLEPADAPAAAPPRAAAADGLADGLLAHARRKLRAALDEAVGGEAAALAAHSEAAALALAERLVAIAARWHGAAAPAAAAVDAAGLLLDASVVNERLRALCELTCDQLAVSPAAALAPLLAPAAPAAALDAYVRAAVRARLVQKARARWTFATIQTQHAALREAPTEWAEATHEAAALRAYAAAAEQMGERAWVQEGFDWCAARADDFFLNEGWRRLALRPERKPHWHAFPRDYDAATRACFEARAAAPRAPPPAPGAPPPAPRVALRLLDIGSCYNPFSNAARYGAGRFEVTALDLWPGRPGVLRCDFLDVALDHAASAPRLGEYTAADGTAMAACVGLPRDSFDVAVLSLVLSYLPSARQRTEMVRRARALLKAPTAADPLRAGLLLIVDAPSVSRPDRAPRGAAAKRLRPDTALSEWIRAAEALGLRYVRYDLIGRDAHALAFQTVPGETPDAADATLLPMPVRKELLADAAQAADEGEGAAPAADELTALDERLRALPDLLPELDELDVATPQRLTD